jgi:hypothetical protein
MKSRNYRVLRNKETGKLAKDFAHWDGQQHVYLPTNDHWEVVDMNFDGDEFVQKYQQDLIPVL